MMVREGNWRGKRDERVKTRTINEDRVIAALEDPL